MRNASWPDFNIAPQVLISCGPDDGCHGGDAGNANKFMAETGITDETCSIYRYYTGFEKVKAHTDGCNISHTLK